MTALRGLIVWMWLVSLPALALTDLENGHPAYRSGDYKAALEWYLKAAQQNDASAQFSIGALYLFGYGVVQDDDKAFAWLLKASEQGNTLADFYIAGLYQSGRGVEQDCRKAVELYERAGYDGYKRGFQQAEWLKRNRRLICKGT